MRTIQGDLIHVAIDGRFDAIVQHFLRDCEADLKTSKGE